MDYADKVARKVYDHYDSYVKRSYRANATIKRWTHLAAFLLEDDKQELSVISCATGTKCLGASQVCPNGFSVNDSHAEVLARRAFIRVILLEMMASLNGGEKSVHFLKSSSDGKFELLPNVAVLFFCSHTPCGDASILPKTTECVPINDDCDVDGSNAKRQRLSGSEEIESQSSVPENAIRVLPDVHRTGAKCTSSSPQDLRLPGCEYHTIGAFRTKPGRGDRTLSMSCSDKIAKWCVMGIQGALASMFLQKPIYISKIIIGRCPYSITSLSRALVDRNEGFANFGGADESDLVDYALRKPTFHASKLEFVDGKQAEFSGGFDDVKAESSTASDGSERPCDEALIWHLGLACAEVLIDGYKHGATKKSRNKTSSRSIISRRSMADILCVLLSGKDSFRRFNEYDVKGTPTEDEAEISAEQKTVHESDHPKEPLKSEISYASLKSDYACKYSTVWSDLKRFYRHWITDERKLLKQSFKLINNC